MISGKTTLIAHIGYPTHSFKAPMIYNPYFEMEGIDAIVVPMGVKAEDFEASFRQIFRFSNIHGALITMPHKVSVVAMLDAVTASVRVAGSCNAVLLRPDGTLFGDMFDGEGFVRGVIRKGQTLKNAKVLVVGTGGVGSAIAASLAAAGVAMMGLYDVNCASCERLALRLRENYPKLEVKTGLNDPAGYDVVVNATPMGMNPGDPMPMDVSRIAATTFVGEVVMKQEMTAFLQAAKDRGCRYQIGTDMLFEQIPAYLEFFGFKTTTAEVLRDVAKLAY
ncbi:MAG: ThiF family adenylyltransferase [Betaproteobacteria bacterium]